MSTLASGDALERLREEQRQIEELLATWARHRRDADRRPAEGVRLAKLIFTLLRVHAALESECLQAKVQAQVGEQPALARAAARRNAVIEAIERAEATPPQLPDFAREMASLASLTRAWFDGAEADLYGLARGSLPDLAALDREIATRQEAMLSAGRGAA